MPLFRTKAEGAYFWVPKDRLLMIEEAPGRLTSVVHMMVHSPDGLRLAKVEVEGRVETHSIPLDGPLRPLLETH